MTNSEMQTLNIIAKYGLKKPFKVRPNKDFRCAVNSRQPLDSAKVYTVEFATNQPDYLKFGKIFCGGFLLEATEYSIVNKK